MQDCENLIPLASKRVTWNKGKLIGPRSPLRQKHVWAIRTKLQIEQQTRDLAMFNLAIDSKLRGCDVVTIRFDDVAPNGYTVDRATVRQKKTGRPVRFELTEQPVRRSTTIKRPLVSDLAITCSLDDGRGNVWRPANTRGSCPSGSTASDSTHGSTAPTHCGGPRQH
jgi:hypothetical protein